MLGRLGNEYKYAYFPQSLMPDDLPIGTRIRPDVNSSGGSLRGAVMPSSLTG